MELTLGLEQFVATDAWSNTCEAVIELMPLFIFISYVESNKLFLLFSSKVSINNDALFKT